jgi:metal-sulfur cluster biosynthetic enzyme
MDYNYSSEELELIRIINDYRVSIDLNKLGLINHVSYNVKNTTLK